MSSDPVIAVDGLSKAYRIQPAGERASTLRDAIVGRLRHPLRRVPLETFWALKDVDLSVSRGEIVGVIGSNGAGKSTLLKILCRITEPTEGQAVLRGRVGSLLEVGTGFHPELTGRENIYLNGAILGMQRSEITRRLDEIIEFSGIGPFLETPVKRYSSGMYVRLAFAVAAHLQPEILIVDEVLAVGDAEFQQRCLGKMGEAASGEGRTILFVSHNLAAVESLCTRAICLRNGKVVFDGAVEEAIGVYLGRGENFDGERDLAAAGATFFRSISLRDEQGLVAPEVKMGASICFAVRMMGLEDPETLLFGMHLRSGGVLVSSVSSRMYPAVFSADPDQRATIRFPRLTLAPGAYTVDLGLKRRHEPGFIDFVAHALSFEVIASDIYGSGYLPTQRDGLVFIDAEVCSTPMREAASDPVSRPLGAGARPRHGHSQC